MEEKTVIRLMQNLAQKLVGKISAYEKHASKYEFVAEVKVLVKDISELVDELEKKLSEVS